MYDFTFVVVIVNTNPPISMGLRIKGGDGGVPRAVRGSVFFKTMATTGKITLKQQRR